MAEYMCWETMSSTWRANSGPFSQPFFHNGYVWDQIAVEERAGYQGLVRLRYGIDACR